MKYLRSILLCLYLCWLAGSFWLFSYAYSSSFFDYNLDTRLPVLLLALLAMAVPPLSAYILLQQVFAHALSIRKAVVWQLLWSWAPILLFWVVLLGWNRVGRILGTHVFEADEAMGIGIDFFITLCFVIISNLVVGSILLLWRRYGQGKMAESTETKNGLSLKQ